MEKELERIMSRLNIIYKGRNPMITIYGDGSWSIEVDDSLRNGAPCRTDGEESGNTIEELEELISK